MYDIKFAEDSGSVVRENHFLEVVDDDLVAAIGSEGGLDSGSDRSARVYVAQDSAIFGVVAGSYQYGPCLVSLMGGSQPVVAGFEQAAVWR